MESVCNFHMCDTYRVVQLHLPPWVIVVAIGMWKGNISLGWGLLSQFPPFRYFPNFLESQKHALAIEYHVYIWQVSPQLSCGDTCQIWMWSKESNRYFCKIENFACGEISERSFSNPHTWSMSSTAKLASNDPSVLLWLAGRNRA